MLLQRPGSPFGPIVYPKMSCVDPPWFAWHPDMGLVPSHATIHTL